MYILGISAFYHDSAAALVCDGEIVAAAQEERFSRRKHDASFPLRAIDYCLRAGGLRPGDLDAVAFYDKPITTFHRLLRTSLATAPAGMRTFRTWVPAWVRQKLWTAYHLERGLRLLGHAMPELYFCEHHQSHAASAFFASPFPSAAILTFDGVGEWATSSIGHGQDNRLRLLRQLDFPHSLGLLYAAFTAHCGFEVNGGEYKLMGLAPYGEGRYVQRIFDSVVDVRADGSFRLDLGFFGYLTTTRMTNRRFARLFDGPPRTPGAPITPRELDLARSVQLVTEDIVLRMARHAAALTGESAACLAGGVALNAVANGRLRREGPFDAVWVQPAAGDAGGSLGAALYACHQLQGRARRSPTGDAMRGCALGPEFSADEIRAALDARGLAYVEHDTDEESAAAVAQHVAEGSVVGLFSGRMEFGPRALGHRSILADAREPGMQQRLNAVIKQREGFRPFAPAVLAERAAEWFDDAGDAPHMTHVAPLAAHRLRPDGLVRGGPLDEWVSRVRSEIPAVTHVDGTARLQTVSHENPQFREVLRAFERRTGCPVMLNTSFNGRDEPIVCTPGDAICCFEQHHLDVLMLERFEVRRPVRPELGSGS